MGKMQHTGLPTVLKQCISIIFPVVHDSKYFYSKLIAIVPFAFWVPITGINTDFKEIYLFVYKKMQKRLRLQLSEDSASRGSMYSINKIDFHDL